eukprot:3118890-Prymnesium_polylepis.1
MSQGARGLDLRKQGERRTKASKEGIADAFKSPFDRIEIGAPGETRVIGDHMTAVRTKTIEPTICDSHTDRTVCLRVDPPAVHNQPQHAGGAPDSDGPAAVLWHRAAPQRQGRAAHRG